MLNPWTIPTELFLFLFNAFKVVINFGDNKALVIVALAIPLLLSFFKFFGIFRNRKSHRPSEFLGENILTVVFSLFAILDLNLFSLPLEGFLVFLRWENTNIFSLFLFGLIVPIKLFTFFGVMHFCLFTAATNGIDTVPLHRHSVIIVSLKYQVSLWLHRHPLLILL